MPCTCYKSASMGLEESSSQFALAPELAPKQSSAVPRSTPSVDALRERAPFGVTHGWAKQLVLATECHPGH